MTTKFHPGAANRHQRRMAHVLAKRDPKKVRDEVRTLGHEPLLKQVAMLVTLVLAGQITAREAYDQCDIKGRGWLPRLLHDNGATPEMVRDVLIPAWECLHARVAGIEKTKDIIQLFKFAEFPIPDSLPETITVWRGTVGVTVEQARRGYSWSLHRACSCYFALVQWQKEEGFKGRPLLLRREVKKRDLVYFNQIEYSSGVIYSEVLIDAPPAGEVDGCEDDWRQSMTHFPWV